MIRRAEVAILAGTVMSVRRMVAVVALAKVGPVRVAAARVRLNAITAQTSQAAFAENFPTAGVRGLSVSGRRGRVRWSRARGGFCWR